VFLASTRTFRDKNLCQSSRKFSVGYCGHSRKIFFRFYSSKTDPIKVEKAHQKPKERKEASTKLNEENSKKNSEKTTRHQASSTENKSELMFFTTRI